MPTSIRHDSADHATDMTSEHRGAVRAEVQTENRAASRRVAAAEVARWRDRLPGGYGYAGVQTSLLSSTLATMAAMATTSVRRAAMGDVPAMVALSVECMDFHAELDQWYRRAEEAGTIFGDFLKIQVAAPLSLVQVADQQGAVVGYCLSQIILRPPVFADRLGGTIAEVAVSAEQRRNGIGARLVQSALDWFRSRAVTSIQVNVSSCNDLAESFWASRGFEQVMSVRKLELAAAPPG